jgi:hypothetical protein
MSVRFTSQSNRKQVSRAIVAEVRGAQTTLSVETVSMHSPDAATGSYRPPRSIHQVRNFNTEEHVQSVEMISGSSNTIRSERLQGSARKEATEEIHQNASMSPPIVWVR